MAWSLRILHLEDDPLDAELVECALEEEGTACNIRRVDTRDDFITTLDKGDFDIILSDYSLPGFNGFSALDIAKERCPDIPFIFVTGKMGEELAIETLRYGATDYVLKTGIARLASSVQRALRETRERSERRKAVMELRKSHEQLRSLAAHLQSAREEERTNIAREIHDELGQALTALKIDLSLIAEKLQNGNGNATLVEQLKADVDIVNSTILTVKKICTELRPAILDHLGLGAALQWQAEEFQKRSGIKCEVTLKPYNITADRDQATVLFRIFQEALTNVLRHSKATNVKAVLTEQDNSIMLQIADNGVGFTVEQLSKANSFGLVGMRERVHICNGELRISGRPNEGATITALIPRSCPKK